MGLFEDLNIYFNTQDLYEVLGLSQDASEAQLKAGYRKAALYYHPDRVGNDEKAEATKRFQLLSKIYCTLKDKKKRDEYDETGFVDEENVTFEDEDWTEYFRILFPRVTRNDIDNFMKRYKGSDEELEDLKKCYLRYEGNMNLISQSFIGYDVNKEIDYRTFLTELIKKNEVPAFPKFTEETASRRSARIKRNLKEVKVVENLANESDLVSEIRQRSEVRQQRFNKMIGKLTAKYCKQSKKEIAQYEREARAAEKDRKEKAREQNSELNTNSIREKRQKEFEDMVRRLERKYVKTKKSKK